MCNRDRVPRYVINLDLPPGERWNQLITDKKLNVEQFYLVKLNIALKYLLIIVGLGFTS